MLAAALRRCAVAAAAARAGPRGLLHPASAPSPAAGMNTLVGYDLVPEPKIIDAALRACRRLNDFASAVRILEVVKDKAGPHKEIYPYVIQELRPTLNELGISTPEELGLDKV
uniref:Cytochrome c oxidase subunit 5A, mitochondrial n=1 Tax=Ictidomys tridecemlineatus TaxID=43179 RepID=A0A287D027_ICTTR